MEKYSEDLKELQIVRETTTQIERPSDAGRDALLRYAAQLEALEAVFPVSETEVGRCRECRLVFCLYDTCFFLHQELTTFVFLLGAFRPRARSRDFDHGDGVVNGWDLSFD